MYVAKPRFKPPRLSKLASFSKIPFLLETWRFQV